MDFKIVWHPNTFELHFPIILNLRGKDRDWEADRKLSDLLIPHLHAQKSWRWPGGSQKPATQSRSCMWSQELNPYAGQLELRVEDEIQTRLLLIWHKVTLIRIITTRRTHLLVHKLFEEPLYIYIFFYMFS